MEKVVIRLLVSLSLSLSLSLFCLVHVCFCVLPSLHVAVWLLVQAGVFGAGYPSLPTMTLEEFAEKECQPIVQQYQWVIAIDSESNNKVLPQFVVTKQVFLFCFLFLASNKNEQMKRWPFVWKKKLNNLKRNGRLGQYLWLLFIDWFTAKKSVGLWCETLKECWE